MDFDNLSRQVVEEKVVEYYRNHFTWDPAQIIPLIVIFPAKMINTLWFHFSNVLAFQIIEDIQYIHTPLYHSLMSPKDIELKLCMYEGAHFLNIKALIYYILLYYIKVVYTINVIKDWK